jgi:hypothetical protein
MLLTARVELGLARLFRVEHIHWIQGPNLSMARALAFAASSSRFLGGAVVSRERSKRFEMAVTSSTVARKISSLAFEGLLKPVIFLTNWSEAARVSSSVTGGSKLNRVLILRHISYHLGYDISLSPERLEVLGGANDASAFQQIYHNNPRMFFLD